MQRHLKSSLQTYIWYIYHSLFLDRSIWKIILFFWRRTFACFLIEKLAEGAGFEPAARTNRAPDFESGAFNQLSHPSIDLELRNTKPQNPNSNKGRKQKQGDSFNPLTIHTIPESQQTRQHSFAEILTTKEESASANEVILWAQKRNSQTTFRLRQSQPAQTFLIQVHLKRRNCRQHCQKHEEQRLFARSQKKFKKIEKSA